MITTFSELGEGMVKWGEDKPKEDFGRFMAEYYETMNDLIKREKAFNGWFTEEAVRSSLFHLGQRLNREDLTEWLSNLTPEAQPEKVGIIMAGNIPLVGFHDFLSVILTGNKAVIKLSSDDNRLFPEIVRILIDLQPDLGERIKMVDKLSGVDKVIATGSNNSARYFEKYFGHLPNIIRKNRTSVAVIDGTETKEELELLGKDIFTYFGLGCRNVSHLIIPENFDLDRFFGAIVDYGAIINHHKYANNYDYYKAIYLMNQEKIIENGFVLLKESEDLFSPIAVLFYHRYSKKDEVQKYLSRHKENIQVVVGHGYTEFGLAQSPRLDDYADGINTLDFLC